MSPPPLHPNNRYSSNSYVDDRGRYSDRYSPDSRYDDMASSYASETDLSPPRSPEPRYRDRGGDDYYRHSDDDDTPAPKNPRLQSSHVDRRRNQKPAASKGSTSSSSGDCYDDW